MISLYTKSHFGTFTLMIYNYMWIPFLEITQSMLKIFLYLWNPHQLPESYHIQENTAYLCQLDLPVSRFSDWGCKKGFRDGEEETCTICLMDFEKEEVVNKLPRCGHVFHSECMEKWLDRCQFTCPLCRASVLNVPSSKLQ